MDKHFLRYSMFLFTAGILDLPPNPEISKKAQPRQGQSSFFLSPVNIEVSSSSHREVFCKKGLKNSQNSQENTCIRVTFYRVLARSYLMTLCVILSIHVNFPITSRCVLKAPIQRKKVNCVTLLEKAFFVSKRRFYGIVHHVVFHYFFHLITICVFFPCFFIYHLSIIFAISCSLHAVLSQYS